MKISVQTQPMVRRFGADKAYRMIREAGFEAVDWGLEQYWKTAELIRTPNPKNMSIFEGGYEGALNYLAGEIEEIRKNGLTITQAHAPNPAFIKNRYDLLEYAIGIYRNMIHFCQAIGCYKFVIHGIHRTDTKSEEEYVQLNHQLYESLIPDLLQTDVKVCIENLPCCDSKCGPVNWYHGCFTQPLEAKAFVDEMNQKAGKECFGFCLDTGHMHLTGTRFTEFVPVLGKRIIALHIHDNNQQYDAHLMPYTCSVRWEEFISTMKEIGYEGDLSFEICRQIDETRMPLELIPSFMRNIADIGKYFRDQLQK